ncbi:MAG: 2OG-Fe(II) oxygenase [Rhodocyclales bacterium]|nr:2OG-Fe(II) oxygenase [Rhodocyclales bacterium]
MLVQVENVLNADELTRLRALLDAAQWADGRITAGTQSAKAKQNRQLPESAPQVPAARAIVGTALSRHGLFFSAALPRTIYPQLFNRYGVGENFGAHIDNAVRLAPDGSRYMRTDISATLFLCEPDSYEGGELIVQDTYGEHRVKLPAGDMILYPSTSLHRVTPVTRGERQACFFWIQSMVRDDAKRELLFNMDSAIATLRQQQGDTEPLVTLTGTYHNLLRMWSDV